MGVEIRTEELVKSYRGRRVVDGISVSVHEGEIVGLLGHNGAAKTTTFYMVVGLVKPDRGRVLLNGQNVTRQPMYRRGRAGGGHLAPEPGVFREVAVEGKLRLVLPMSGLPARGQKAGGAQRPEGVH